MDNVPSLRGLTLSLLSTSHLLFLLHHWPCLNHTPLIIDLLCSRDLHAAIAYLLSLPYSHGHREELKHCLRKYLKRLPINALRALANLFPHLTATVTDENGVLFPRVGPLDDQESGLWDSNDFFFQLLHAKNIEGTFPLIIPRYCISLRLFCNASLRFL